VHVEPFVLGCQKTINSCNVVTHEVVRKVNELRLKERQWGGKKKEELEKMFTIISYAVPKHKLSH
jgi:hypothetical protein